MKMILQPFGESLTNIDINNQDDLVPKDRVEAVKEPYRRTSEKEKCSKKILVLRVLYLMVTVMALVNWQIIIIVRKYMKYI